jgi:hypothetical protein
VNYKGSLDRCIAWRMRVVNLFAQFREIYYLFVDVWQLMR